MGLNNLDGPFVSVVIPCLNAMRTIGDCLDSLANQTYSRHNLEVLLVDNGSTDGTCEFVRTSFQWVRLLQTPQKGSGYARNVGISEASGEYVLSTDADCVADPSWITELVGELESAAPEVAAIGGRIVPFSTHTAVERYRPSWVSQPDLAKVEPTVRYAATPNAAFRSALLKAIGSFDGALGFDDTDLGMRLFKAGYQIIYTDKAVVRHRNPDTLRDLYQHKLKYGKFNFQLALKYPEVFGDPKALGRVSRLFKETTKRVIADLFVKLPYALLFGGSDRPRIWPAIDAVSAIGNYKGFAAAVRSASAPSKPENDDIFGEPPMKSDRFRAGDRRFITW